MIMLQAIDVSKRYHRDYVIRDFNLEVKDRVGIIGFHKSGKTVIVKILAGEEKPSSGKILLDGRKLDRKKVAYIPQVPLFDPSLKMKDVMKYVDGEEFLDELNLDKEKKIKDISLGERKLLSLALSLPFSPEYLLIDDFTMECEAKKIFERLMNKFKGVIIAHHNFKDIWNLIDKVVILSKGKTMYEGDKEGIMYKVIKTDRKYLDKISGKYVMEEGKNVEIWEEINSNDVEKAIQKKSRYKVIEVPPDEVLLDLFSRD
jgi:ABC-type multidrug transport system ATPase subunit